MTVDPPGPIQSDPATASAGDQGARPGLGSERLIAGPATQSPTGLRESMASAPYGGRTGVRCRNGPHRRPPIRTASTSTHRPNHRAPHCEGRTRRGGHRQRQGSPPFLHRPPYPDRAGNHPPSGETIRHDTAPTETPSQAGGDSSPKGRHTGTGLGHGADRDRFASAAA